MFVFEHYVNIFYEANYAKEAEEEVEETVQNIAADRETTKS
jgi:hypothetical protein